MKVCTVLQLLLLLKCIAAFQLPSIRSKSLAPVDSRSLVSTDAAATLDGAVSQSETYDWGFLDAVYLITCPNADKGSVRLNGAKRILKECGLGDEIVQVKEFETDDEDRIRGCYTSHISVLKDAQKDLDASSPSNPIEALFQSFLPPQDKADPSQASTGKRILVVEDNIAATGLLDQNLIDEVAKYTTAFDDWDVIQLSYIPYVPSLTVSKTNNDKIVKLSCGIGSALGTTAYIINQRGLESVIRQDEQQGYYAPIPDVMAELFPETRFAAFPTPFLRAPKTRSLVNPQLDDLRSVLFQAPVVTQVQNILITTGLSTNALLPISVVSLLAVTFFSGRFTLEALSDLTATGSYDGPIALVGLSLVLSTFCLAILLQGVLLAPKPPKSADESKKS